MSASTTTGSLDDPISRPNTILREPTGSVAPHLILMTFQLLAMASSSFPLRRAIVIIATLVLSITYLSRPHFTNNFALAQPFSMAWSTYLTNLEKLAAPAGPEASFWRVDKPAREAVTYSSFGLQKLRWSVVLVFNMRGIRWNHQVKKVPAASGRLITSSKLHFLGWQVVSLVYYVVMADLVSQLGIYLFYTAPGGRIGAVNSKYLTIRSPYWSLSFTKALVFGATPYYILQLQYTAFSILFVSLGLNKPKDWPPTFGTLSDVTTLREFWGQYWHQTLRRMFNTYTGAAVDAIGIPRGTMLSSYIQLWLAFLMSGVGHAASILVLPSPVNITLDERTIGLVWFFLSQAALITLEDLIQWLWNRFTFIRSHHTRFNTIVGYIWVVWTLWYTLPMAGDVYVRMRLGEESMLPFTLFGPVLRGWDTCCSMTF